MLVLWESHLKPYSGTREEAEEAVQEVRVQVSTFESLQNGFNGRKLSQVSWLVRTDNVQESLIRCKKKLKSL